MNQRLYNLIVYFATGIFCCVLFLFFFLYQHPGLTVCQKSARLTLIRHVRNVAARYISSYIESNHSLPATKEIQTAISQDFAADNIKIEYIILDENRHDYILIVTDTLYELSVVNIRCEDDRMVTTSS